MNEAGWDIASHSLNGSSSEDMSERRSGSRDCDADRFRDLEPLTSPRVHVLMLDPFQAVAGDIPAGLVHGGDYFGIAL